MKYSSSSSNFANTLPSVVSIISTEIFNPFLRLLLSSLLKVIESLS